MFLSPTAIPSESHHQTETSPSPAAVNGGQNGHGQAEETHVATSVPPVNGTNGNGKHHTSDDDEAETAAAKSISNGSSEKQENGTTKVGQIQNSLVAFWVSLEPGRIAQDQILCS